MFRSHLERMRNVLRYRGYLCATIFILIGSILFLATAGKEAFPWPTRHMLGFVEGCALIGGGVVMYFMTWLLQIKPTPSCKQCGHELASIPSKGLLCPACDWHEITNYCMDAERAEEKRLEAQVFSAHCHKFGVD